MKKILFTAMLIAGVVGYGQNGDCTVAVPSEETGNGGNITTGGTYEYASAADFDVERGTIFTVNQIKFHAFKGPEALEYVIVNFWSEVGGMPGVILHTYANLIPVSQEFAYTSGIENMDAYQIVVDIPETELPQGKYFMELQAAPGDEIAVSWEIAGEYTTSVGRFDISRFDQDPWFSGFSYYDQVFEIVGSCESTGEEEPDYGDFCSQGNAGNEHETGLRFPAILADDFIVEENTTFFLSDFKMTTLQLGNIINADIKIRKEENGLPGEIVYSVNNKGPKTEKFFGYWPFDGFPLDVVAVDIEFEFDEVIELTTGRYFIEVKVTPVPFSDFLAWEATSEPGIGGVALISYDQGGTWEESDGLNLVFEVNGFCKETLGVNDMDNSEFNFYPNPVKDELTIQSKSDLKNVSVYNLSGQLMMNSKSKKINMKSLSLGVYIVKAELENGKTETFKIIKK